MLSTQVTEVPESSSNNLGDENVTTHNGVETQPSQCETNTDNAFAILDSNRQHDDQKLVEVNNVDNDRLINQTDFFNNVSTEVNANQNHNNIDSTLHLGIK